jgi:hypothetical protein
MEKSKLTKTEKGETCEEQSQKHVYHFFLTSRDCWKEFILASQTVISAYYCDVLRWLWKFAKTSTRNLVTKELAAASRQWPISRFFFTRECFTKKQHDWCHPPTILFSVSAIEHKTVRPPFWHNSGDRGRSVGNCAYTWKGTTLRMIMASRPKVSFWSDGSISPGNYERLFVLTSANKISCVDENSSITFCSLGHLWTFVLVGVQLARCEFALSWKSWKQTMSALH